MAQAARLRWVWLSLAVVLLDRATKAFFEMRTPEGYRRELVANFIYLVHSRNPGIAFGLLADAPSRGLMLLLVAGSLAVIAALAWMLMAGHAGGKTAQTGLALILGGATGNLTDRILHGGVTDFFEVLLGTYHWPAFNVADSAITVGAALVVLELLFGARPRPGETSQKRIG